MTPHPRKSMNTEEEILELAEQYLQGSLSTTRLQQLEARRQAEPAFNSSFESSVALLETLREARQNTQLRAQLRQVHARQATPAAASPAPPAPAPPAANSSRTIPLRTHYRRIASIAAGVALLASLGSFWALQGTTAKSGPTSRKLLQLGREIENVKKAQTQQQRQIQSIKQNVTATPAAHGNYGGTAFAITNDGYLATNYHVTDGADSIFVQIHNTWYRAYVIAYEAGNDVAVLKIDDSSFRFSKTGLPYTIPSDRNRIGARIWTLGYPQDEVVYNEGYISSRNGYQGDSAQYRLELPANPGQSGAPIIDNRGNILGMITGKESQSQGTTFAITSFALLRLLRNMPHEINLTLPQANKISNLSREQQVEKMQNFTCLVQVYKSR